MKHRVKVRRFVRQHVASVRTIGMIAIATSCVLLIGAKLITVTDPGTFPRYIDGLWWAITTITTVGDGDITLTSNVGRLIGSVLMLCGITALALLSGSIAALLMEEDVEAEERHIERRLDEMEHLIRELVSTHRETATNSSSPTSGACVSEAGGT